MTAEGEGPGRPDARRAVEAVWRIEAARIVASLTRVTGDFALAEDVAQEALAEALASWPASGVPANPGAWLVAVGKRRAIDHWRRRSRQDERFAALARELRDEAPEWDPESIEDDVLRLVFVACHPVLSREASIALTLRVVGGLTTHEIARVFLVPVATVQQRIVRAKKTLAAAAVPFEVPTPDAYPARLSAVLSVLYLIFTEGHSASGDRWLRPELSHEALRLARVLAGLVPEPEVHGLVALMALTAARFPARIDAEGRPVLLADQDRTRWDRDLIALGRDALARGDALGRGRGPYALQAAIACCHDTAVSVDETDWERIVLLYEALGRIAPSPVVGLNHAVAVSMSRGPEEALRMVDELVASGALAGHPALPGVRGELLIRLGRRREARVELERAAQLTANAGERDVFERKLAALG